MVESWLPLRDEYLDELLRREGRRTYAFTTCSRCGVLPEIGGMYRCIDCGTLTPHCASCTVKIHSINSGLYQALHRPEFWNGSFFEKVSLSSLGLVVNLGHDGGLCPDPTPTISKILVFHTNGYHEVSVRMCGCAITASGTPPAWQQFLRADIFPSTHKRPKSAFTIALLKLFHEMNLQAKTNMYDFYNALLRMTDNSGVTKHPELYKQFCHVVRLWRHLRQLKRAGRGHDPAGIRGTRKGALAVTCAACPQVGKNLPDDWEMTPVDKIWIYTLYLMMDANFRCRCKDRGLEDIELAPGWSYYVDESDFRKYLNKAGLDVDEKNSCSAEHNAILKANLRKEGYIASGVGAVLCARHALFRPCGTADLHLGEKFAYMDYLLVCTLLGVLVLFLVISYDVACQYCRNFEARLRRNFPVDQQLDLEEIKIRWMIPKNHIAVHGPRHSQFSLNLADKVGRTYGEGVESSWSHLNPVSVSTREMALATRHEVLNDHMSSWNWHKTISFAVHFNKSLHTAHSMGKKQRALFEEFSATFSPEVVQEWTRTLEQWAADPHSVSDPFEEPQSSANIARVRVELGREDSIVADTSPLPQLLDMSPITFIQLGLELEENQRVLRAKKRRAADKDIADAMQQQNALRRRIYLWLEAQNIYMPSVLQLRLQSNTTCPTPSAAYVSGDSEPDNDVEATSINPEDIILWLPSSLPPLVRVGDFTLRLVHIERRLRTAQVADSLNDIRRLRRMLKSIAEFKRINVSGDGNRANTRSRALYDKFVRKQTRVVERYRTARKALLSLDPDGDWKDRYRELLDSDITGPGADESGPGEGHRIISWIWRIPRDAVDDNAGEGNETHEYNNSMRAEWATTKARADRWTEEEELLLEEMRRVLVSFERDAQEWDSLVSQRAKSSLALPVPSDILDGVRAYAHRQALIRRRLMDKCAHVWIATLSRLDYRPEWAKRYAHYIAIDVESRVDSYVSTDGSDDEVEE
ncbi:hypothetical protein C8Q79DRAFT_1108642 [Trametes meyenii]|nr:hypothetical protein C8Q79DRAFT_1108642 [Trametes meyenii]